MGGVAPVGRGAMLGQGASFAALCADERAFGTWYELALPRVYGFVLGCVGSDIALAEEITAHAFMETVRARRSIDGRADPITWICSITRNRRIDHYRRVERDQVRHLRLIVTDLHASETSYFFSRCRIWLATVTLLPIPGSQEMTTWRISWPLISGVSDHAPGSQTLARVWVEWGVESPVHATAVPSGPGAEP